MGKNVARVGDVCTCPIPGHNNCTIVEGDPYWTINGRHVALEGHKTSCGATLISSCSELGRSYEGDGSAGEYSPTSGWMPPQNAENTGEDRPDEQVRAVDAKTGEPIPGLAYYIKAPNGSTYTGQTDTEGLCKRIATYQPEELSVWFGEEAEQKARALR